MAIRLEEELHRYGCDMDAEEFRDVVQELKAVMFPTWTREELALHPEHEATVYVRAVRSRVHCEGLPDHLIMRTLFNCEKRCREWGDV